MRVRMERMASDQPDSPLARRHFLGSVAGVAATSFAQTGATRPNIISLPPQDSGRYLQPYGHAVPAPNLQRLANEGVLFRQAFNAAPTSPPRRPTPLTGKAP